MAVGQQKGIRQFIKNHIKKWHRKPYYQRIVFDEIAKI